MFSPMRFMARSSAEKRLRVAQALRRVMQPFADSRLVAPVKRLEDSAARQIIDAALKDVVAVDRTPLFKRVEIETVNRCNGSCSFCPVNKHEKQRPYRRMDERLFDSILAQLSDLGYRGAVALFSNNEPLLDPRIIDLAERARAALPHAFLYVISNGRLMTREKLDRLMQSLDHLVLNNYSDAGELHPPIAEAAALRHDNPAYRAIVHAPTLRGTTRRARVEISRRRATERRTTRGGAAPNREPTRALRSSCILPFMQLVIRPDGKVSLCCNDALGQVTLGDAATTPLEDIWHSTAYRSLRSQIVRGRATLPLCRTCDTLILPDAF